MISDILFEASEEINRYLAGPGETCGEIEGPLNKIVILLDAARAALDTLPPPITSEADLNEFWKAVAALDIRPVQAALKKLESSVESP